MLRCQYIYENERTSYCLTKQIYLRMQLNKHVRQWANSAVNGMWNGHCLSSMEMIYHLVMLSASLIGQDVEYIPRNMHTVFALLCFVVVIHWLIFPYQSGLLHWHCGNLTIAPVPAKQPWLIWINTSCEFIMNDCITATKQSTTKPCAYFLGYTVYRHNTQSLISDLCESIIYSKRLKCLEWGSV